MTKLSNFKLRFIPAALILLPLAMSAFAQQEGEANRSPHPETNSALSSEEANSNNADDRPQTAGTGEGIIYKLGHATALADHPGGRIFGPLYLSQIDLSGFYQESVGNGLQNIHASGSLVTPHIVIEHALRHHGIFALQYDPQIGVINDRPINNLINQQLGVDFDIPLTPRWSVLAGSHFNYFNNQSILNPAGLQFDAGTGTFFQYRFAQLVGSSLYEDSNISFNYDVSGRTRLSLSPEVGTTMEKTGPNWAVLTRYGGRAQVNHMFTPSRQVSVFYDFTRSDSPIIAGLGNSTYIYNTAGISINQRIGRSLNVVGSLAASLQRQANRNILTPTGDLALSKQFRRSSVSAAYSRSRSDVLLAYSGYIDQADLSAALALTRKSQVSLEVGDYRTIETLHRTQGRRAGGAWSYRLFPRVSLVASYNFLRQTGTNSDFRLGDHHLASIGLSYVLVRPSEAANP